MIHAEPIPTGDPGDDRYRLLHAVATFLRNASAAKPLLLVLEDLHDADHGTLDMLTYLSRNLGGSRVLVVGTYRDVEVDRAHPLSGTMAELRRVSSFERVSLRGLTAEEVQRLMSGTAGHEVSWGVAEAVHRQTEGNPLFAQEVVRYLVEGGLLAAEAGRPGPAAPVVMSIPEGLRDVIGKRLSGLSPECNRVLVVAAVIGREFWLDLLQKVAGVAEDELFAALEDARAAAVVEERSSVGSRVTYRFAHAFFRQTLYEETIAPRRIRLHQQVARALTEVYVGRLDEHAVELAEHFSLLVRRRRLGESRGIWGDGRRESDAGLRLRRGGWASGEVHPGTGAHRSFDRLRTGPGGHGQAMRPAPGAGRCPDAGRRSAQGLRAGESGGLCSG